jgi:hypothetical protein
MFRFICIAILLMLALLAVFFYITAQKQTTSKVLEEQQENYWFVLHRASNKEYLYKGIPGNKEKSEVIKVFTVKSGIPGERPTPLPQLVGREYWLLVEKHPELESPETAPYFITLDVPVPSGEPYGPQPYLECGGVQCNWSLPGAFGLHGVNGDLTRLSDENVGSSGCVRHSDEDITYLYNLLDFSQGGIAYYIEDI